MGKVDTKKIEILEKKAVITDDFSGFWKYFFEKNKTLSSVISPDDDVFFKNLGKENLNAVESIMNQAFPGIIRTFDESVIINFYREEIKNLVSLHNADKKKDCHIIVLDRYQYQLLKNDSVITDLVSLHHLSFTRSLGNLTNTTASAEGKEPRIGDSPIEDQISHLKESFKKASEETCVTFLDDCTVAGGTIKYAQQLLQDANIHTEGIDKSIFFSQVERKEHEGNEVEKSPHVYLQNIYSFLSAERRETSLEGGAIFDKNTIGNIGYQEPLMMPFSHNAEGLRIKGLINARTISKELLEQNIKIITEIEEFLAQKGETYTFSFFDFKEFLPSDKNKNIIRSFISDKIIETDSTLHESKKLSLQTEIIQMNDKDHKTIELDRKFTKYWFQFMRRTPITEFLEYAKEKIDTIPKPEISHFCFDIDGTFVNLQNETGVGFHGSTLEKEISDNAEILLSELEPTLSKEEQEEKLQSVDPESGLINFFIGNYRNKLETQYGEECIAKIRLDFEKYYGAEEGKKQAEDFIQSEELAYHVFRYKTWDFSDIAEIYPTIHTEKIPLSLTQKIEEQGGINHFITAAPKIHALKTLHALGFDCNTIDLHTMEDMYKEKEENGVYFENKKDIILQDIQHKNSLSPDEILMTGDQFRSDISPAQALGMNTFPLYGPQDLETILSLVNIKKS